MLDNSSEAELEPMSGAVEMFSKVYDMLGEDCQILTGIPKPKRGIDTAGEDKTNWAHRLLSDKLKVNIVYREEKKKFCFGKDCILIDDLAENIESWENCGGTGILFESAEKTLKILEGFSLYEAESGKRRKKSVPLLWF